MPLTKEKTNVLNIAENETGSIRFPEIDKNCTSYYIPYEESRHEESVIMKYDSELPVLRKRISTLWNGTELEKYSGDVLSGMFKCKDSEENLLEAIDLFNYMM